MNCELKMNCNISIEGIQIHIRGKRNNSKSKMKNGYSLASESLDMTSYLSDPVIKYFSPHGQFGRE